jgi:hypothetical protein
MIFLKPKNIFQHFSQFVINLFFRLRISLKKKIINEIKNNLFLTGDFFQSLSQNDKNKSNIIFSTLNNFPKKKIIQNIKIKLGFFIIQMKFLILKVKKN